MYQTITVPAGGGVLSWWYKTQTFDTITFDWQDVNIRSNSGTLLANIQHECTTHAYQQKTFNLAAYAGQTIRVEFLVHQDGFGDVTNMYVDDVAISAPSCCAGCTPATITTNPGNVASCATSTVSFSVVGNGTIPFTYQWQESTGGPFNNIFDGGIYSGTSTATLTLTGITGGMNGNQYRCLVTSPCGAPATSNAGTLTILTQSVGGTTSPANVFVCATPNNGTITLAGQTGNIIRWEFSIDNGVTWTPIANTTNTLNWSNVTVTTLYRAVVQVPGCTTANSTNAAVTVNAVGLAIVGDRCTNLCQGDGVTLTAMDVVLAPTTATMNPNPTSTNATITLNFRNNNAFPVVITGLSSMCNFTGATNVSAYYKTSAINGPPGQITPANGWNQFGSSQITSLGAGNVQPFPCVSLTVPAGATYGILVQAVTTANGNNIVYNNANVGVTTVSAGGCDLITGTNIGYAGGPVPSAPGVTPRYFIGSLTFRSVGVPITIGTFAWAPATGLNATNTNPVAAAPATTTTYTVTHNNGTGCVRTATVTISVNQRPVVTANPVNKTVCATNSATFTAAGTGTNLTYQWQESRDGGITYITLLEVAPYSGTATATLTINPVTFAMNNYLYRCVLGGACTPYNPPTNITTGAKLTVNPLPVVTVSPAGPVCGGIAGTNTTALTASGADIYFWSPVAGLYTDAMGTVPYTGTNLATVYAAPTVLTIYTVTGFNTTTGCSNTATVLVNYTPPAPTVTPNSVTMCLGDPAVKLKSSSAQFFTSTFPSLTGNNTAIPDGPPVPPNPPASYPATVSTATVSGIPANATITAVRVKLNLTHAGISDMVIALKAPNGNILNLDASISQTWGGGANMTNTVISSNGSTALGAGTPPYTGTFKADAVGATFTMFGFTFPGGPVGFIPNVNNFAALYSGPGPNGTWSLGMYDNSQGGTGTFNNFSIDFDYVVGVVTTPATWSPAAGLFSNAGGTIPYVAGTPVDSVWTMPSPGGVYTYNVTVNGIGPVTSTPFTNNANIAVPGSGTSGPANPYPATVNVSGLPTSGVTVGSVTLSNISHTFESDMGFVLQSPSGQNVVIMNAVAGTPGISNATYTFSDAAAAGLPAGGAPNGNYKCTNNSQLRNWLPPGPGVVGGGSNPALATFTGNPNGTWNLYAFDFAGGDVGNVAGGFTITFNTPSVGCLSPSSTVTVTVNTPISISAQPVSSALCTDKSTSFSVTVIGTSPTYQWQVSTNNGTTWTNITNGSPYSGATTRTLTITAPPVSYNGYLYRCVITGAAPCGSVNSNPATLTVNPLPTVVISASPYRNLFPSLRTTISATSTPAAATYLWSRNGSPLTASSLGLISGLNTSALFIDVDGMGTCQVRVTDVNGCVNNSNTVTIGDSVSSKVFIYPNPNSGQFQVRYDPTPNNVMPRGINVYNAMGQRLFTQYYSLGLPYARMDVNLKNLGSGVYWLEVVDANNVRLAVGRVEVLR